MRKSSLLYTAFGIIVVVGVLHNIAVAFYLYWTIWWFDIMMHFLAGFAGGLVMMWFFSPTSIFRAVGFILVSVLIIGVVWETWEYLADLVQPINYWQDTIYDLVSDMVGAALSCLYAYISGAIPKFSLKSSGV